MQVTESLAEGLKRELKVVVPAADLATRLDDYLADMKDKVKINGFRPGKVPAAHLKKLYGRQAMAELIGNLINETTGKTLEERGEKPALQPEVDLPEDEADAVMAGTADLNFTISYEILPNIELIDFSAIELERPIVEISDEEVDEQVKQVAESNRPFEAREEGAAVVNGDKVKLSYLGKLDGEPFEGGADENGELVIGSGQFIPGFEEQIVDMKVGDKKVIDVTFPEEYGAQNLAGRAVTFDIEIKEILAPGEVEINDEMATKLGLENLDKLKEIIRGQIESQFGAATRQKIKRTLLDKLDEAYTFELPEKLLESEFDGIWKQVVSEMEQSGKTFADEDTTEEEAKEEYRKIAERRVRLGLVLSEVGEKNKVEVSEDEVQRALFDRVRQFPGQEQQVFEFYKSNQQALASLRAPIYEEKCVDFILELAKITDKVVSKEELLKQDEEEA
ncbi:trigger factor [Polycladidibacter stylochi]|uniref:trigger factor n=1 Tax=Polycladidibacter stylochi TaxID=1807766 RepID=UPI00082E10B1|nr:trigger factor [Pseudovibrio stylochi]